MSVFVVDFDDTVASGGWPDIKKAILIPEAKKALQYMRALGHKIIIWTCREDSLLTDALGFLDANEIPYDFANENDPERIALFGGDCRKVAGDFLIDDKCVGGIDWDEAVVAAATEYMKSQLNSDRSNIGEVVDFIFGKHAEIYQG